MSKVLVKFCDEAGDDTTIWGFGIMEKSDWVILRKDISNITDQFDISPGQGTALYYGDGKTFLQSVNIEELTDKQNSSIVEVLGSEYGYNFLDAVKEVIYET